MYASYGAYRDSLLLFKFIYWRKIKQKERVVILTHDTLPLPDIYMFALIDNYKISPKGDGSYGVHTRFPI